MKSAGFWITFNIIIIEELERIKTKVLLVASSKEYKGEIDEVWWMPLCWATRLANE